MNTRNNSRWIVKDRRGHIYGPFSAERMQKLIRKSVFVGDELVAQYPEGDFLDIKRIPEFYDSLLEALSGGKRNLTEEERRLELTRQEDSGPAQSPTGSEKPLTKPSEKPKGKPEVKTNNVKGDLEKGTFTQGLPNTQKYEKKNHEPEVVNRAVKETPYSEEKESAHTPTPTPQRLQEATPHSTKSHAKENIIELETRQSVHKKEKKKNNIMIFFILAVSLILYFLLQEEDGNQAAPEGHVELLYPKVRRGQISEGDAKKRVAQATQLFQKDNFSSYYRTMSILVDTVESGYQNVEALSLLCLTFRELWTYAKQDSNDLAAVSKVAQMAAQKDPIGLSGATCRIVQLLIGGQSESAKSLIDSTLNTFPQAPTLYDFKASLFSALGDTNSALAYNDKALQLWPAWLKLFSQKAAYLIRSGNHAEAATTLREISKQNPKHAVAKALLGELEYFYFKNANNGFELSRTSLETDRLPNAIAARMYILLSVEYELQQKRDEAIAAANKAVSLDPTNPNARELIARFGGQAITDKGSDRELVALGEEYVKKGNHFAAQAEFKAAFEANPQNGRAAMLAAQSLWELNQSLEAIEWAQKAIKADAKLVIAYVNLADYYSQRFDFKSAQQFLQRAQRISPQSYQVIYGYALVELRRLNYKSAAETAKKAIKLYDTDVDTHIILAQAQLGQRDDRAAFETVSRAINLDQNNKRAQAVYAEVLASYQGVDRAAEYLKNLINTYPQYDNYRATLGKIFLHDDRIAAAIEMFNQTISINERHKPAMIMLGQAHEKSGDNRAALKSYLSAAALDPADVHPLFLAGEVYINMRDFQKAAQQFQQVVKINSLYPKGHYKLGQVALLAGDVDRALKEAALEKRLNPNLVEGYVLAGDAYMKKADYSKAAAEYQKAVSLQPSALLYISLARAYRLSDNLSVASSLLARALKIEDGNPYIYKEQGAIFEARGERVEAIVAYQKYLQLLPGAPDREEIETRIRKLGG